MRKKKEQERLIVPESFEINAKDYFTLIKEQNIKNGNLLNDLKVYSRTISLILTIPMRAFEGKYYIPIDEVQKICVEEFKHLSKNKESEN